jgi:ketosteroid isomerase-like protein
MKSKFLFLICFLSLLAVSVRAADDASLTSIRAADEQRVAAVKGSDAARLASILSDDLRYAHSTGGVDTKKSYIESLTSGRLKYVDYDYEERNFTFPAPGVALMTGRVHVKSKTATGESESVLGFLAVWREEKGEWKFLAWQSCKLPPAKPTAVK